MNELCIILKLFECATKTIRGEDYMTASMILPIVNGLTEICTKMKTKTFEPRIHKVVEGLLTAMVNKNSWENIYHSVIAEHYI